MPKSRKPIEPGTIREISWLYFNERVLDEAADPAVPLIERIKFLGIYSNNLDEFFRVRVGTLNRLARTMTGRRAASMIKRDPRDTLKLIQEIVVKQRAKFERIFRKTLRELARENILIVNERQLSRAQIEFVEDYFHREVRPKLFPIMLDGAERFPDLRDKSIYLAITLKSRRNERDPQFALMELPTDFLPRFLLLPKNRGKECIILLDDIIRLNLPSIFSAFGYDRFSAHTIKLTRDAEMDLDDDIFESYLRKISKGLRRRKGGLPVRLVYDSQIPKRLLDFIVRRLHLSKGDPLIAGARYHNFKDFMKFPEIGPGRLRYPAFVPAPHKKLSQHDSVFKAVDNEDILLHVPYQRFEHLISLLQEASIDPQVTSIKIMLYRAAPHSSIVNALINAAKNGKSVTAVVELQARFDEEANIFWSTEMQEAGVKVIFGVPGLKVHAKLCLITRKNGRGGSKYAVVGTGNFNEITGRVYTDHFLLTANPKITEQVASVFEFLQSNYKVGSFRHFLVSPFNMRRKLTRLIETEVLHAESGKEAWIFAKLNHITDAGMIDELYKASRAGVKIRLIVRGMFTLEPGLPDKSENIQAIRIVDRFLEHARVLFFANGGKMKCFLASADWMPRNLDRRVEVACPIFDEDIRNELYDIMEIQWRDNTKAEIHGSNRRRRPNGKINRAQMQVAHFIRRKNS